MKRVLIGAACALALAACSKGGDEAATAPAKPAEKAMGSGITLANFDKSVEPGDDFYRYVNGSWLAATQIPSDKSNYGSFTKLADDAEQQLLKIIEDSAASGGKPGSNEQKVGAMYASFMNNELANEKGIKPLQPMLDKIDAVSSKAQLPEIFAELGRYGVTIPIAGFINQDAKDPTTYIVYLWQWGLSLPDRDYYLEDTEKFKTIRAKYLAHLEKMLAYTGEKNPAAAAKKVMAYETALAKDHWTRVENRDDDKTYNKREIAKLNESTPGFDAAAFLKASGVQNIDSVILSQPSYAEGMAKTLKATDLATIKAHMKWQTLNAFAAFLSDELVAADFDFFGKVLRGVEENRPRWKRGVALVEGSLGEVLGAIYVDRHFPPQAKARMETLVDNLIKAYEVSIKELDWMGDETKAKALDKLSKFTVKIGYPDEWKDYSALEVKPDDLLGNVMRSRSVEHDRELAKLGAPVDKGEWHMTPQTVNAYYNPPANEIVFPAAILQPPFFDMTAEDAVNYGGIGAVIGHEIGHGFDDQGSKYDGDGVLRNWWTDADRKNFEGRTSALNGQYDQFCPLGEDQPCVKGELTIGENIGDLGGLSIALKAYKTSVGGGPGKSIDGFTGVQRVFLGWAQVWRRLYRDEELLNRLKTDPHSPSEYRANGIVRNIPEWYEAFNVSPEDDLYLPPEQRVRIW